MLQPHWLDEVILRHKKFLGDLQVHPKFKRAIQNAERAFQETQEDMKIDVGFCGPAPEQAARVSFIKELTYPT